MPNLRGMVVVAALMTAGAGTMPAAGAEYAEPSGLSFVYPEGWTAVSGGLLAGARNTMRPDIQTWMTQNSVQVLLIHNGRDGSDFRENLNVVVEEQQLPLSDRTLKTLGTAVAGQYESMGAKLEDFHARIDRVGTNQAAVIEYRITFPGRPAALRQKQVLIPGGGRTYVVTCSAEADSFADHARSFDDILASIKVPPPVDDESSWDRLWSGRTSKAVIGAACGVIGVLVLVLGKKLAGRKERSAS